MRGRIQRSRASDDRGLGIVEILVALMIFAVLSVSIAYATTYTIRMTRDNQARQVAVNLASADIDAVRAKGDPFDVNSETYTVVPATGSGTYTVKRTASWATATGAEAACGTAGAALQYKKITVTVEWASMLATSDPVITDTLMAPTGRINDPTKGTILVSVKNAMGGGAEGVTFTSTPAVAVEPTDADGCSFLLQVAPGTYTIKLNTANYIDAIQVEQPSITQTVTAGSSSSYTFQYDKAAKYTMTYASNSPGAKVPTDMATTFLNTYGTWPTNVTGGLAKLHPYPIGYQAVAGKYVAKTATVDGCASVDPEAWDPDTRHSPAWEGKRLDAQTALPGGSAALSVPMGIVTVAGGTGSSTLSLFATSQPATPIPGQPTCADVGGNPAMTYNFGTVIPNSGSVKIALPYGSWKLFTKSSTGVILPLATLRTSLDGNGYGPELVTGLIALDPRVSP